MKRLAMWIGTFMTVTCVVVAGLAAPASATTWSDVWIQQVSANECAAVLSASNPTAVQASCVDAAVQLWNFTPIVSGSATNTVQNLGTALCLTAVGTAVGDPVDQGTCAGGNDERWTLVGSGNTFELSNVYSGLCLAHQSANNTALVQSTCSPRTTRWQLLF